MSKTLKAEAGTSDLKILFLKNLNTGTNLDILSSSRYGSKVSHDVLSSHGFPSSTLPTDDNTLSFPVYHHVPEHGVCQRVDVRGVLVAGLPVGSGYYWTTS